VSEIPIEEEKPMKETPTRPLVDEEGVEPAWDIAYLFPPQGQWTEDEYLALDTKRLVELSNGRLEVLPMPTTSHQFLVVYLYGLLLTHITPGQLGTVLIAALPVRLWRGKIREPDVVFMLKEHASRIGEKFWKGADLVMEVVSEGAKDRQRDLVKKRREYARAGIPEYWIVDPFEKRITVLKLAGKEYVVHGEFSPDDTASSALLAGFTVDVGEAFAHSQLHTNSGKSRRKRRK